MNTHTFFVAVFIASFGMPLLASAQSCTTVGAQCTYNGNTGTCVSVEVGTDTVLSCNASSGGTGTVPGSAGSPPGGVVSGSAGTPPSGSAGPATTLINPLGNASCSSNGTCLSSFLTSILRLVIQIGAVVVVLMLVYVGFLFVVARGDPGKITTARTALLWTVVGALVLLGAQAIASGIQATIQALGG